MGRYSSVKNIEVAGVSMPMVNINSMADWQSSTINDKVYIPQILYKDGHWVAVQDLISAVGDDKEVQILAGNIKCEFCEDSADVLRLHLRGWWSLEQLEVINEAIEFIPCKGSRDISFAVYDEDIMVVVRFDA